MGKGYFKRPLNDTMRCDILFIYLHFFAKNNLYNLLSDAICKILDKKEIISLLSM